MTCTLWRAPNEMTRVLYMLRCVCKFANLALCSDVTWTFMDDRENWNPDLSWGDYHGQRPRMTCLISTSLRNHSNDSSVKVQEYNPCTIWSSLVPALDIGHQPEKV
jgi:hypothetical protein